MAWLGLACYLVATDTETSEPSVSINKHRDQIGLHSGSTFATEPPPLSTNTGEHIDPTPVYNRFSVFHMSGSVGAKQQQPTKSIRALSATPLLASLRLLVPRCRMQSPSALDHRMGPIGKEE